MAVLIFHLLTCTAWVLLVYKHEKQAALQERKDSVQRPSPTLSIPGSQKLWRKLWKREEGSSGVKAESDNTGQYTRLISVLDA